MSDGEEADSTSTKDSDGAFHRMTGTSHLMLRQTRVHEMKGDTGVCEKGTSPDKNTLGEISLRNTTSGAGEEFLLLFCRAPRLM